MAVNVEIFSREFVKPSSSTPLENRIHKLSFLDQTVPPFYYSLLLFYSKPETGLTEPSLIELLKTSLSKTLTLFYPFAGRLKDDSSIVCNDFGVSYSQARVDANMSKLVKNPCTDMDVLGQLCASEKSSNIRDLPLLAIQVNLFECGGVAIGVSFIHVAADASSIAWFVKEWAATARGGSNERNPDQGSVVVDCTSLFPPLHDAQHVLGEIFEKLGKDLALIQTKTAMKRLVFEGSKIAVLKEKIGKEPFFFDRPVTRAEALYALVWGAIIGIALEENHQSISDGAFDRHHLAVFGVNIRKRLEPPLPTRCIGNVILNHVAKWPLNMTLNYNLLACEISRSIRTVDNGFFSTIRGDLLRYYLDTVELVPKGPESLFKFNSWCNFPFYESDFGFGKPMWFVPTSKFENLFLLFDAEDGKGIEAWIALPEEYMAKFERDPAILEFASFH